MSLYPRESSAISQALAVGWEKLNNHLNRILNTLAVRARPEPVRPAGFERPLSEPPASPPPRREAISRAAQPLFALRITPPPQGEAWLSLLAQMSHDLRTPLNAVIGFSDVMNSELLGPVGHPRYREYAGNISDCGRQLLKAAEDTLAMTALLANPGMQGAAQPIPVEAIAAEAWSFLAAEATARGIGLDVACASDLELLGERRPVRQIMINLLAGALARTENGRLIRLIATDDVDTVRLEVVVTEARSAERAQPGALPLSLARALLELQGAGLLEISGRDRDWRAVTVLDRARQRDFFAAPEHGPWHSPAALAC